MRQHSRQQKQSHLVATLRKRILDGTYRGGQRLPPHVDLLRELGASPVTLQRAMDRLSADGFVEPRGRHGTFVTERPPHLCNYALLFDSHPGELHGWSRFWSALSTAADTISAETGLRINVYHDINGHSDSESMQLLIRQLQSHRLAGLIFASPPYRAAYTPVVEIPGIPRVGLMERQQVFPGIPALATDAEGWLEQALDYLAERGRRRVAFLVVPDVDSGYFDRIEVALSKRGMTTQPYWILAAASHLPHWAQRCAQSLLRQQGQWNDRPDALVIADDHLVDDALRGVIAAGTRVPDDLEIVAHANFPDDSRPALPIRRIGFDARTALRMCIDMIDRQRRGERLPDSRLIPVITEAQAQQLTDDESDRRRSLNPTFNVEV